MKFGVSLAGGLPPLICAAGSTPVQGTVIEEANIRQ